MEHQEVFFLWCTKVDLLDEHDRLGQLVLERHLAKRLPYLKTRLRFDLPAQIGWGFNTPGIKWYRSAEDKRFELLKGFPLHAFQACALGRYANPPGTTFTWPSLSGSHG